MTQNNDSSDQDLAKQKFVLGEWVVDPVINQLSSPQSQSLIVPKLMETLVYFAEHQGEVVSGEQITKAIWQGSVVGENSLYNNIAQLRKSLGDTAAKKRYIETIPRKGYRLIAPVGPFNEALAEVEQPPVVDNHNDASNFLRFV
ncbi:MAG: transcriptional regulator, partial [Psychrosphaera sp.]|nr:transcriptional regulator [Psychrosphaera sp.]